MASKNTGELETMNISKDSEFFYSFIVFQVEDTLFKVTRKPFLEESDVFRDMFNLPNPSDASCDGVDQEHPLRLDGIACDDFRAFLKALYAPQHHDPLDLTSKQWLAVLDLSHMWQFMGLRDKAIRRLDSSQMDAIQRIHVARKYEIPDWVPKSYAELVQREDELADEEATQLGAEEAFKITRFRSMRKTRVISHFTSGHSRMRVCPTDEMHSRSLAHFSTKCKRCGEPGEEEINDGCEAFEVPGVFKIPRKYPDSDGGLDWSAIS